jgi:hypothetical protein
MVDWIMTFAFPWVRRIKKVTLAGAVKTDAKARWERILRYDY